MQPSTDLLARSDAHRLFDRDRSPFWTDHLTTANALLSDANVLGLALRLSLSTMPLMNAYRPAAAKTVDLPHDPTALAAAPVVVDSAALFGRSNEVRVRHNGQEYRLRITKAGKLILTK